MRVFWQFFIISTFSVTGLFAQEGIAINFPEQDDWNIVAEGEVLEFKLKATGGLSANYSFSAVTEPDVDMQLSKEGEFYWKPAYDLVSADEKSKKVSVIFEVSNEGGQVKDRQVDFIVKQSFRLSPLNNLAPFFIRKDTINAYQVKVNTKEFEFVTDSSQMPSGMKLSKKGVFLWNPDTEQYAQLRKEPVLVKFYMRDLQYGDMIPGALKVLPAPQKEPDPGTAKASRLKLQLPDQIDWSVTEEGQIMSFKLGAVGGKDQKYKFTISQGAEADISFDTLGNFYWKPDFDFVDRLEESKLIPVIFEVSNGSGQTDKEQINLLVYHTNRSPEVDELKPFYVQYGVQNSYQLNDENYIHDPDNDPLVFKPILSQMPQGMTLSGKGELNWKPSSSQYYRLQQEPMKLEFLVEDQPYKSQTVGKLKVEVSQQDLPPDISMVPNQENYHIKENETLNLRFYLSDPNGDEDILIFDFVTDNSRIPKSALVKNDPTQWEFVWTPDYDFFIEPGDTGTYTLTFFVIDRSNQREEKQIKVTIEDAENLAEKDRLLYSQYRTSLIRVWNLMEQLREKEKELKKDYRRAKRGKKQRAITTASLGAITGVSPVVLTDDPGAQKVVSGIGGTTSMTLGSLEASNVIGRDPSSVFEKLSYITQKLNELETQGNVFAGKYALSNTRRSDEFSEDLKKLIVTLNLKEVTTLELDASWQNPKKPTDKNIQNAFKDFNPDESKSTIINE